ncbi:MAG: hypothetical protein CL581_14125 [Alteromonadaceae bacterium]|nr:hypothetical protein [Alteromonadaceae bacterium]
MSGFSQETSGQASYPSFVTNTGDVKTVAGLSAFNTFEDVLVPNQGQAFQLIMATAQCNSPAGNSRYDLAIIDGSNAAYLAFDTLVNGGSPAPIEDAIINTSEPVVIAYPAKLQVREKSTGSAPVGSLSIRVATVRAY